MGDASRSVAVLYSTSVPEAFREILFWIFGVCVTAVACVGAYLLYRATVSLHQRCEGPNALTVSDTASTCYKHGKQYRENCDLAKLNIGSVSDKVYAETTEKNELLTC